jgi:hypothetical protein
VCRGRPARRAGLASTVGPWTGTPLLIPRRNVLQIQEKRLFRSGYMVLGWGGQVPAGINPGEGRSPTTCPAAHRKPKT